MISYRSLFFTLLFAVFANAQTCENYGLSNGSSCQCPTGFGGATCSQPGCGGTIFQGTQRPLATSPGNFANLTAAACSCTSGWTGTGCNVCQSADACQSGFAATGTVSANPTTLGPQGNETMTCNKEARVYASSQMSCRVDNPTLQALYPLSSTLNIMRTLQPALSPIPNATSFGTAGSGFAQLFYDGVEQFYCQANSCTQELDTTGTGSSTWQCQNLQCTCRPGTTFCGAVPTTDLTKAIDGLTGNLGIACGGVDPSTGTATCSFQQATLQGLFGANGLTLNGCTFGECVRQNVIDGAGGGTNSTSTVAEAAQPLSNGVIAGLAVVGGLLLLSLGLLALGLRTQRLARKNSAEYEKKRVSLEWSSLSYVLPGAGKKGALFGLFGTRRGSEPTDVSDDKVILDNVSGKVKPGKMMAILGPSGAGKTTLVEILAGKSKSGNISGTFGLLSAKATSASSSEDAPRIGFVPQQDILPPTLTVFEALLFAARLRLPESIPDVEKSRRVDTLLEKLGISSIRNQRIGDVVSGGGKARGISGGEMRRVSIGLELIAEPDVLLLDEPTSGLDSVSAKRVADVLGAIAEEGTPIVASIHQPSSQLYHKFDLVMLLAHGRALYSGPGGFAPADHFSSVSQSGSVSIPPYQQGYNVAEYLLEVANDPPVGLFQVQAQHQQQLREQENSHGTGTTVGLREVDGHSQEEKELASPGLDGMYKGGGPGRPVRTNVRTGYATTFLTQFEYLCGREWKILKRDKTLFLTHVAVGAVLGVFCGGLYFNTGITIAGFQSRVGCLFFLGALIAFSSLSALYNMVEIRPLFLRERSSSYYSPTAWLLSRFFFDMIPLRLIPNIIVSSITYWMAGLANDPANFFKFLLIIVLYSLAMTLFNFLLGTLFQNGGIAILLSALSALYQMTFAGFFVHLSDIPPVLRWLQWLAPLKYTLEALSVNEVDSGLMIVDSLQGVPVSISASLIMNILFGFGLDNYYRDVLILVGFTGGFGVCLIGVVWFNVRERR